MGEPGREIPDNRAPWPDEKAEDIVRIASGIVPGVSKARIFNGGGTGLKVLLISLDKGEEGGEALARVLLESEGLSELEVMVLVDHDVDPDDGSRVLWKLCNNVDPGLHFHWNQDRLVIDACRKGPADGHFREWPEDLRFDVD